MTLAIAGGSMAPALRIGERVRVEPLEGPPSPGDVVAFLVGDSFLVHRVLARTRGRRRWWLVHRGDASARAGVAGGHQVVGRVSPLAGRLDRLRRRPAPLGWHGLRAWCLCATAAMVETLGVA